MLTICVNTPLRLYRVSYLPCSTMRPSFKTNIVSQFLTVDRRWAIRIIVFSPLRASMVFWTSVSDSVSRALVASSKMRRLASL